MIDLLEDSFPWDFRCHHIWHVVLQLSAEKSAGDYNYEQYRQDAGERTAESEASMEQDKRQTQQPKPQVAAHPSLSAT